MTNLTYYIICGVLAVAVLVGIAMMSKVKTAAAGNLLSACALAVAILVVLWRGALLSSIGLWVSMILGLGMGALLAYRVKMIQMPQMVALLNGLGGAASALVAIVSLMTEGSLIGAFAIITAVLALVIGMVTLSGSLVAAGKLAKLLPQRPVVLPAHALWIAITLILSLAMVVLATVLGRPIVLIVSIAASLLFGVFFSIRVGGADMPITISLLNSLSGVAGAIAGMAIDEVLLVAVGGIVGASGLLLTQIMCKAMNRGLMDILLGKTSVAAKPADAPAEAPVEEAPAEEAAEEAPQIDAAEVLRNAKNVIFVPGYGMALAQAQSNVKELADKLEARGAQVRYAIHPVAGRMPGHMNVLLCEVDVSYDQLYEMNDINDDFASCDLVIIVGANDVVNPAAGFAEGTPIYGMPVLKAADAPVVIVCNFDLKPGYAGVPNPLYTAKNAVLMLGDAQETVTSLSAMLD
ncbi:MAG: NAD(P)(+) transhydrogenase (Re/Si-specific) subunit beta [Firmicutes bacterium]|nr:NAD(P)(+) transhydrogenase (Re/Si-specific) subunit beta [Bacillota bacterium]